MNLARRGPAASVVIIAEPQWKPTTEEQAVARAYRMGQVRKVHVYRLLSKESIDERIRELQDGKSLLFDEFARKSVAKDADPRAVDSSWRDDATTSTEGRIMAAERHRPGMDGN